MTTWELKYMVVVSKDKGKTDRPRTVFLSCQWITARNWVAMAASKHSTKVTKGQWLKVPGGWAMVHKFRKAYPVNRRELRPG